MIPIHHKKTVFQLPLVACGSTFCSRAAIYRPLLISDPQGGIVCEDLLDTFDGRVCAG